MVSLSKESWTIPDNLSSVNHDDMTGNSDNHSSELSLDTSLSSLSSSQLYLVPSKSTMGNSSKYSPCLPIWIQQYEKLSEYLINSTNYFNVLLSLLSQDANSLDHAVFSLLRMLPPNRDLDRYIMANFRRCIDGSNEVNVSQYDIKWSSVFSAHDFSLLCYQFLLFHDIRMKSQQSIKEENFSPIFDHLTLLLEKFDWTKKIALQLSSALFAFNEICQISLSCMSSVEKKYDSVASICTIVPQICLVKFFQSIFSMIDPFLDVVEGNYEILLIDSYIERTLDSFLRLISNYFSIETETKILDVTMILPSVERLVQYLLRHEISHSTLFMELLSRLLAKMPSKDIAKKLLLSCIAPLYSCSLLSPNWNEIYFSISILDCFLGDELKLQNLQNPSCDILSTSFLKEIFTKLLELVKNDQSQLFDDNVDDVNPLLVNYLHVTWMIVHHSLVRCSSEDSNTESSKAFSSSDISLFHDFIDLLFHQFLFIGPDIVGPFYSVHGYPRSKNIETRKMSLILAWEMASIDQSLLQYFLDCGRSCYLDISHYSSEGTQLVESRGGYDFRLGNTFCGIVNPGCLCYLISVVQSLFMMKKFRMEILSIDFSFLSSSDLTALSVNLQQDLAIFQALQLLFAKLQDSLYSVLDIKFFYSKLVDHDRKPINPNIQQDASEFLSRLFQSLENVYNGILVHHFKALSSSSSQDLSSTAVTSDMNSSSSSTVPPTSTSSATAATVPHLFASVYGELMNELRCDVENKILRRPESFFYISVEMKNFAHLLDSLDDFIKGEKVDYTWTVNSPEKKREKLPTIKRTIFGRLPHYLAIQLKRFEFDFDSMRQKKINDRFQFPLQLDMEPYLDVISSSQGYPVRYELCGVLVHSGNAFVGHYYCILRDSESGNWLKFNDSRVSAFDVNDMESVCFGGNKQQANAFMLFYERSDEKQVTAISNAPSSSQCWKSSSSTSLSTVLLGSIRQTVQNENRMLFYRSMISEPSMLDLWEHLLSGRYDPHGLLLQCNLVPLVIQFIQLVAKDFHSGDWDAQSQMWNLLAILFRFAKTTLASTEVEDVRRFNANLIIDPKVGLLTLWEMDLPLSSYTMLASYCMSIFSLPWEKKLLQDLALTMLSDQYLERLQWIKHWSLISCYFQILERMCITSSSISNVCLQSGNFMKLLHLFFKIENDSPNVPCASAGIKDELRLTPVNGTAVVGVAVAEEASSNSSSSVPNTPTDASSGVVNDSGMVSASNSDLTVATATTATTTTTTTTTTAAVSSSPISTGRSLSMYSYCHFRGLLSLLSLWVSPFALPFLPAFTDEDVAFLESLEFLRRLAKNIRILSYLRCHNNAFFLFNCFHFVVLLINFVILMLPMPLRTLSVP